MRFYTSALLLGSLLLAVTGVRQVRAEEKVDPPAIPSAADRLGPLPVAGASSFVLLPNEIVEKKKLAIRGDGEAAFSLYLFYQIVRNDYEAAFVWLKMAAENGYAPGQYNLAYEYMNDPKIKDDKLANLWLERAAANGSAAAKEKLDMKR